MSDRLDIAIKQYARDLRHNASGGDDYPFEFAKGVADYLETLIKRAKGNCSCAQAGFPDSCDNCDGPVYADTREIIAFELWQRFAPMHHVGWADETHKAEYYAAADGVLVYIPAAVGGSRE